MSNYGEDGGECTGVGGKGLKQYRVIVEGGGVRFEG